MCMKSWSALSDVQSMPSPRRECYVSRVHGGDHRRLKGKQLSPCLTCIISSDTNTAVIAIITILILAVAITMNTVLTVLTVVTLLPMSYLFSIW